MEASKSLALTVILLAIGGSAAWAVPAVQVAGGTIILLIDVDGDGPEPDVDCTVRATFDGSNLAITKTQTNTPLIKGCNGGTTSGAMVTGQDTSSDYIVTDLLSTSAPSQATLPRPQLAGLFVIPFRVDAYEEFPNLNPDGFPAAINTFEFEDGDGNVLATGYLCAAAGPSVLIDFGVVSVTVPLELYPTPARRLISRSPTHPTSSDRRMPGPSISSMSICLCRMARSASASRGSPLCSSTPHSTTSIHAARRAPLRHCPPGPWHWRPWGSSQVACAGAPDAARPSAPCRHASCR